MSASIALAMGVVGTLLVLQAGGTDRAGSPTLPATDSTSDAPPTPATPGGPVRFEGAVLTVPAGWVLEDDGAGSACLTRTAGECELRLVLPDVVTERGGAIKAPATDDDLGWYLGTDDPDCRSSRLTRRDLAPIGDKRAEYREWEVDCDDSPALVRMWWLPQTRLAVVDQSGDPAVRDVLDEVVRTADLSALRAG